MWSGGRPLPDSECPLTVTQQECGQLDCREGSQGPACAAYCLGGLLGFGEPWDQCCCPARGWKPFSEVLGHSFAESHWELLSIKTPLGYTKLCSTSFVRYYFQTNNQPTKHTHKSPSSTTDLGLACWLARPAGPAHLGVGALLQPPLLPLSLQPLELFPDFGRRSPPLHHLRAQQEDTVKDPESKEDRRKKLTGLTGESAWPGVVFLSPGLKRDASDAQWAFPRGQGPWGGEAHGHTHSALPSSSRGRASPQLSGETEARLPWFQ